MSKVKIGSVVYLRHITTGTLLKSLPRPYCHPKTSAQQMVVASLQKTDETRWLVKRQHSRSNEQSNGDLIFDKERIRLEHCATNRNLHSHADRLSPVTNQQEVTCLGVNGVGDDNDDWIVELEGGGAWSFDQRVRLIHAKTGAALHSHGGQSHAQFTNGEQEVTGYVGRDVGDLWIIAAADQPAPSSRKNESKPSDKGDDGDPESWFWGHIRKESHHLKAAPLAFFLIFVVGVGIGLLIGWKVILESKNATIEAKQSIIDQKQTLLDDARQENEKLRKLSATGQTDQNQSGQSEMMVTFLVQNSSTNRLEINPICDAEIIESFGGGTSWYGSNPYRLATTNSASSSLQYVIPPNDSREFTVSVPDIEKNKVVFVRGAGTFSYTIWLSDLSHSIKGEIAFNRDSFRTKKAIVRF